MNENCDNYKSDSKSRENLSYTDACPVLFALIHLRHCLWWSLAADAGEGTWHFSGLPSTHKHHANFEHRLPLLCVPEAKGDRASVPGSFVGCAADSTKNDVLLCLGMIGVIETFTQALLSLKLFLP